MKTPKLWLVLTTAICLPSAKTLSQTKKSKNVIVASIPIVWRNVKEPNVYTTIGQPPIVSGQGMGSGLNFAYNRYLLKGRFISAGIGYFKQRFGIHRSLQYMSNDVLLCGTTSYDYQNIRLLFGLGYKINFPQKWCVKSSSTYNQYSTFGQDYYAGTAKQVTKNILFW